MILQPANSTWNEFEVDQMIRLTAALSTANNKLVIGGQIESGEFKDLAALSQINLDNDQADFARVFPGINAITSV